MVLFVSPPIVTRPVKSIFVPSHKMNSSSAKVIFGVSKILSGNDAETS